MIENLLLGAIQGFTEILPISSSGHLIIFSEILDQTLSVTEGAFLHLASALALLCFYYKNYLKISKEVVNQPKSLMNYALATIPVAIVGILARDQIDEYLYNHDFVGFNLIFWGIIFIAVEKLVKANRDKVSLLDSTIIGLAHILALLPGTSRSGIVTLAGHSRGITKEKALDFAFIIGTPLLLGAFLSEIIFQSVDLNDFASVQSIAGFISAYLVTLISLSLIKKFADRDFLTFFGIYRIFAGLIILVLI